MSQAAWPAPRRRAAPAEKRSAGKSGRALVTVMNRHFKMFAGFYVGRALCVRRVVWFLLLFLLLTAELVRAVNFICLFQVLNFFNTCIICSKCVCVGCLFSRSPSRVPCPGHFDWIWIGMNEKTFSGTWTHFFVRVLRLFPF